MPERPDLEYVVPRLNQALGGVSIVGARVKKPVVLRCAAADLRGTIARVSRRSHAVVFHCGPLDLVILPMLAGRFSLEAKETADLAVAFMLSDGRELRYRDDVQMGKVWWTKPGEAVPGLFEGGIDVLSSAFTVDYLSTAAKKRRDQLKLFVQDKTVFDSFGNAYADEALWHARLHPKRATSKLSPAEQLALHAAMVHTLRHAIDTIQKRQPALHEKVRDFLHVRGRQGDPCDRCGTTIRTAGIHGHDAYFCPVCQPDSDGRGFVGWRPASGGG